MRIVAFCNAHFRNWFYLQWIKLFHSHNGMMQAGESINLDSNGVYLIKLNDKVSKFIVR